MAAVNISEYVDQIKSRIQYVIQTIRKRLFGSNNERLDLVIDSFYKLTPEQRNLVLAGGVLLLSFFVFGSFFFYSTQVKHLNSDLNKHFEAIRELKLLKQEFTTEDRRFNKLVEILQKKTATLKMKPFFEKIANEQDVQIEGLTEQRSPISPENPLSDRFQEVKVEMRLNNISIPRVLNFLTEIEKAGQFVRVHELQIRARYGTKLFFDVQLKAVGFMGNQ